MKEVSVLGGVSLWYIYTRKIKAYPRTPKKPTEKESVKQFKCGREGIVSTESNEWIQCGESCIMSGVVY